MVRPPGYGLSGPEVLFAVSTGGLIGAILGARDEYLRTENLALRSELADPSENVAAYLLADGPGLHDFVMNVIGWAGGGALGALLFAQFLSLIRHAVDGTNHYRSRAHRDCDAA